MSGDPSPMHNSLKNCHFSVYCEIAGGITLPLLPAAAGESHPGYDFRNWGCPLGLLPRSVRQNELRRKWSVPLARCMRAGRDSQVSPTFRTQRKMHAPPGTRAGAERRDPADRLEEECGIEYGWEGPGQFLLAPGANIVGATDSTLLEVDEARCGHGQVRSRT